MNDIDETALNVLLSDSEIPPAVAVAASIVDDPQPASAQHWPLAMRLAILGGVLIVLAAMLR